VISLCGCTTRALSDPTTFEVRDGAVPRLRGEQSIAVKNAYSAPTVVVVQRTQVIGADNKLEVDLKEFTDTAIGMLERRMQKDGITADVAAAKAVTLRVRDVSVLSDGFAALSTVTFEAELGNGLKTVLRIKNNSTSAQRALDGAMVRGVTQLLNDEQFLAYINGN